MDNEKESIKDKNFGIVIAIFFIILGMRFSQNGSAHGYWTFLIAIIFLFISILAPNILRPMNRVWTEIGLKMGLIMTPVAMLILFTIAVIPTGFLMRILGQDPLRLRLDKKNKSYWLNRSDTNCAMNSMKNQF